MERTLPAEPAPASSSSTSPPAFGRAQLAVPPAPRALVLINPRGAFAATTLRPLWFLGVLVILSFAIAPTLVFVARVDERTMVEREMKKSGALEKIPEGDRATSLDAFAKLAKVGLPAGAVAKRALWMTLLTLACLAAARAAGKHEARLGPIAGAVAIAMAPLALHDVIVTATFLAKDPLQLDATNAVLSNPAAWLGLDADRTVIGALARGLDFFELWSCALVGLGVTIAAQWKSALPYAIAFGGHALTVAFAAVSTLLS